MNIRPSDKTEADVADRNEKAKKLYRYINDVARRIDEATGACKTAAELFNSHLEGNRQKLRDNCEKLLFLEPLMYGRKAMELLWRKAYYETVSAAKRFRETDEDDDYLFTHIICGIGHFQNIMLRITSELKIQCHDLDYLPLLFEDETEVTKDVDVADDNMQQWGRSMLHLCLIYLGDLSRYQSEMFSNFDPSIAARYYLQASQIDLSLGMPYNQLGNLYMDKNHNLDSICYYIHCMSCTIPFEGAEGNLTKLFEKNSRSAELLPESSANFTQAEHVQCAIIQFLSLAETWYMNKPDENVPNKCNATAYELKLCLAFDKPALPDINKYYKEYSQALDDEILNPTFLNGDIIHKIVQICLFSIVKLTDLDETKAFAAKAFALALLSQLLQKLLADVKLCGLQNPAAKFKRRSSTLEENKVTIKEVVEEVEIQNGNNELPKETETKLIDLPTDKEDQENIKHINGDSKVQNKKLAKRRRRRRLSNSDSSDNSDVENITEEASEESGTEEVSDFSDDTYPSDESQSDLSADESDFGANNDIKLNGNKEKDDSVTIAKQDEKEAPGKSKKTDDLKTVEVIDETNLQHFLQGNNFLPSLKVLQDWILSETDLILSCGESGEALFQCVVDLLNIFEHNFNRNTNESSKVLSFAQAIAAKLNLEYKTIPLPEDVNLRGTNICKFDKDAAEWKILNHYNPSVYEENVIRILNFLDFGQQIAKIVPRIRYNRTMQVYFWKKISTPKTNHKTKTKEWHSTKAKTQNASNGSEAGLLRRLGRLWLTSRVRELERSARPAAPALLALDSSALTKHMHLVKQLLRAKTFLLLVPTVVLQEIDELKKEQGAARDAIRWLETQLQSGSRFVRTQRPNQSRPIPFIKYPRKAPKDVHNFVQILEFCHHFVAEEKTQGGNGDPDSSMRDAKKALKNDFIILLTGTKPSEMEEHKEFSFTGVARSAGVPLEYIGHFYTRWRQSIHKSGKKR